MNKYLSITFWALFQQFSKQAVNLIVSIVLARILEPSVYGTIALISIFIVIGNILSTGGLSQSLIRKKDVTNNDYSSIFLFNLLVSVSIYFILFIFAPFIAQYFKNAELILIIRVLSLTIFFGAFSSVQVATFLKEMKFKQLSLIQIPAIIISGSLGIYLALNNFGVWSLVWMSLIQSITSTLLYIYFGSWRINIQFNKPNFLSHINFSYKIALVDIVEQIFNYIYNLLIWKWYSLSELGFYTRAITLRDLPINNISMALNKITYSMFADISDKLERQKKMFTLFIKISLYMLMPFLLLAILIAKPLFIFLLSEKWLGAVEYFQILCIAGIFIPINKFTLNIINIAGRSDIFLKAEILKRVVFIAGLVISIPFGIKGMLYFQVLFSLLSFWINSFYTERFIHISFLGILKLLIPIFILNIVVFVITYYINSWFIDLTINNELIQILVVSLIYLALYIILSSLIRMSEYQFLLNFLKKKSKKENV